MTAEVIPCSECIHYDETLFTHCKHNSKRNIPTNPAGCCHWGEDASGNKFRYIYEEKNTTAHDGTHNEGHERLCNKSNIDIIPHKRERGKTLKTAFVFKNGKSTRQLRHFLRS